MALTRKLDLRTGKPVWTHYRHRMPAAVALSRDTDTDVLVVGCGISGIIVAHALLNAGHRVAIVDRRGPLPGSTAASTALLQYEIDTPLVHLQRKLSVRRCSR